MKTSEINIIEELIQQGESENLEFKSKFSKEAIITLSALANNKGGKVLIGISDKGNVQGIEINKETAQKYLNEIKNATYPQLIPDISEHKIEGKSVLLISISEYPIKPVACFNRYYKRRANSNHSLSLAEIVDLQQQSLSFSFDSHLLNEGLESLDQNSIEQFIDTVNSTGRFSLKDDPLSNLTKLKLIREGKPTLAAMLLFGDHSFPIHIGRFKNEHTIIDDFYIKKPLVEAIEEAMAFIKKHINLSYSFDGSIKRIETWQYPLPALREILLNAIVHRDYKNSTDIIIKIFDNKIRFSNPGNLFGELTLEDLNHNSYVPSHRNKLLVEMFYLLGEIEKYGTGYIRIKEQLKEHGNLSIEIRAGAVFCC